jgi:hypothetical protein
MLRVFWDEDSRSPEAAPVLEKELAMLSRVEFLEELLAGLLDDGTEDEMRR